MARETLIEFRLTQSIIGAFFDVYNHLGYGFLEHLYARALEQELISRGHTVSREVAVRVWYKGMELGIQRVDMIVDGKVLVETKSTETLPRTAGRQVFNYLRATKLAIGLLLHFGPEPCFRRVYCRQTPNESA
jgi:GxxExxY protein